MRAELAVCPLVVALSLLSTALGQSSCDNGWIPHYSEDFESYSHGHVFTDPHWSGNVKPIVASDGIDSIKYVLQLLRTGWGKKTKKNTHIKLEHLFFLVILSFLVTLLCLMILCEVIIIIIYYYH